MQIEQRTMIASGSRTVTGVGVPISIVSRSGAFWLDVSAFSGTPTLDLDIEEQDPESGAWASIISFTQATGVTAERVLSPTVGGLPAVKYRVAYVIGGGTPDLTFSVGFVGKEGDEATNR